MFNGAHVMFQSITSLTLGQPRGADLTKLYVPNSDSGKGYDVWKKFQTGSVILMTQMTNQKKPELIDDFDQFGLKFTILEKFFGDLH